ncbi:hypothetical protein KPH14_003030 [Odynerus spinipes]|uniref:Uncharacterized protein n=1 Tax=Odynerus spinipes TaxID=1348599 RepID=A0AAD9VUC1_9HYME|nr:hypothetical protein KPH14_003030 [Odynerus spinipes]
MARETRNPEAESGFEAAAHSNRFNDPAAAVAVSVTPAGVAVAVADVTAARVGTVLLRVEDNTSLCLEEAFA